MPGIQTHMINYLTICYNVAVSWQWPHMFGVRSLVFDFSPPNLSISLSLDATAVITPTKEHKDMSGLERFEPLLEGVHLTTNLLYDPVGPSGLSETPSGHSCPPQLQLKSIRTGVVLKGLEP